MPGRGANAPCGLFPDTWIPSLPTASSSPAYFPTPPQVVSLACAGRRGSNCEQEVEARSVRGGLCPVWPGSPCLVEGHRGAHSLLSLYFYSLKLECEKLATEKTEIQRHYVMVSEFHLKGARPLGGFSSEPSKDAQHRDALAPPRIWVVGPGPAPCFLHL